MSDPFLAEIRITAFDFAPRQWAFCNGQTLDINQNQALYALISCTFGGDCRSTFCLPDMRGRAPVHRGETINLGERGGYNTVNLAEPHMPKHSHTMKCSTEPPNNSAPNGNYFANSDSPERLAYANDDNLTALPASCISAVGKGLPHTNMQPSLSINFIISLQGQFPSRN